MNCPQFTVLKLQPLLYSSVSRSSPAEFQLAPAASHLAPAVSVLGLLPCSDPLSYSLSLSCLTKAVPNWTNNSPVTKQPLVEPGFP